MSDAVQGRLQKSQEALETALDNADYVGAQELLAARAPDIEALVQFVGSNPSEREWVKHFLERDRDITARLTAAMSHYQRKVDQAGTVRQVHRAYIKQGSGR